MKFQGPNSQGATLKDYEGKVIALAYLEDRLIPTAEYGTSEAVLARFFAMTDTGAVDLGETLVFPQVLRSQVKNAGGNAVVGRLTRRANEKYTDGSVISLEALTASAEEVAINAFTALVNN